jgi:hypothetical protein
MTVNEWEGLKLDRTFLDKASGKDVQRPQLAARLAFVREDDTVICHSMDRLSRNRDDLHRHDRSWSLSAVRQREPDVHRAGFAMANLAAECDGCVRTVRAGIAITKRAGAYRGRKRVLSEERARS